MITEHPSLTAKGALGMTPVPKNWRICNKSALTNGLDTFALIINKHTGSVAGLTDDNRMLPITENEAMLYMDLPARIKYARLKNFYTQSALATRLGVSTQTIRYWECGLRKPRDLKTLGEVLNVTL